MIATLSLSPTVSREVKGLSGTRGVYRQAVSHTLSCATFRRSRMVVSLLLLTLVLLFAGTAGAALLARLLRDGEEPELRADAVISFALPVGLILGALPGWLLSAFVRVPIGAVAI